MLLLIGGGLAIDSSSGACSISSTGERSILSNRPPSPRLLFGRLWVNNWSWVAAIFPIFLLLYVFPTGNLPSRRWIWAPRLMIVMTTIMLGLGGLQLEDRAGQ